MSVDSGKLVACNGLDPDDSRFIRMSVNFYNEEAAEDGLSDEDVYCKGFDFAFPLPGRLYSYVSPEQFVGIVSEAASLDASFQQDGCGYLESRDGASLSSLQARFRDYCVSARASLCAAYDVPIARDVDAHRPVVYKVDAGRYDELAPSVHKAVVLDMEGFTPGISALQPVEYEGPSKDGFRFRLNYEKDGSYFKGLPVVVKGVSSPEERYGVLYRLSSMMESGSGSLLGQVALLEDLSLDASRRLDICRGLEVSSYEVLSSYFLERKLMERYDVKYEKADSLVSVDLSDDGSSYCVSLNCDCGDRSRRKGVTFTFPVPERFRNDGDRLAFCSRLEKAYASPDDPALRDKVFSWVSGYDRKQVEKSLVRKGFSLDVFDEAMDKKKGSLDALVGSFVYDSFKGYEQESLLHDMSSAYGTRPALVEVLRSDEDEVQLRLNYFVRDKDGNPGPFQSGVVYSMSWHGADSVLLENKASFLFMLEEEFSHNDSLMEKIRQFNLSRFSDGLPLLEEPVQLQYDSSGRELRGLVGSLEGFDDRFKFGLPGLRRSKKEAEDKHIAELRARSDSVSSGLAEIEHEIGSMGVLGRFRMRLFHYRKWHGYAERRDKLRSESALVDRELEALGAVEPRVAAFQAVLTEVHKPVENPYSRLDEYLDRDSFKDLFVKPGAEKVSVPEVGKDKEEFPEVVLEFPSGKHRKGKFL